MVLILAWILFYTRAEWWAWVGLGIYILWRSFRVVMRMFYHDAEDNHESS